MSSLDGSHALKLAVALGLGYGLASAFHRPLTSLAGNATRRLILAGGEKKRKAYLQPNGRGQLEDNRQLLLELLSQCQDTALAGDWGLAGVDSFAAFDAAVPLTDYNDYREYVGRAMEGEKNVLAPGLPGCFATTSGTTGGSKYIPFTIASMPVCQQGMGYCQANLFAGLPGAYDALAACPSGYLSTSVSSQRLGKTKAGIPFGPLSTFNSDVWLGGSKVGAMLYDGLMALLAIQPAKLLQEVEDYEAMLYLNLLFAIAERRLPSFTVAYAPTLLHLFQMLEANCRFLLEDLRSGSLSCDWVAASLSPSLRQRLGDELKRRYTDEEREKRVRELEDEFSCGFLSVVHRIWPSMQYISCSISGAFAVYEEEIRQYAGDVRIMLSVYMASEGFFGATRGLTAKEYVLSSRGAFFEFLPMAHVGEAERQHLVQAGDVKVGEEYEVVISTLAGFWRYRLGDVIRVVDKMADGWPVVEICYRVGGLLDVHGEKTSEEQVTTALRKAGEEMGVSVVNFTSRPLLDASPAAYCVYVEVNNEVKLSAEEVSALVDGHLQEINAVYAACRQCGKLGSMQVQVVPTGTFDTFFTIVVDGGAAVGQAKVPHLITKEQHIAFFTAVCSR